MLIQRRDQHDRQDRQYAWVQQREDTGQKSENEIHAVNCPFAKFAGSYRETNTRSNNEFERHILFLECENRLGLLRIA